MERSVRPFADVVKFIKEHQSVEETNYYAITGYLAGIYPEVLKMFKFTNKCVVPINNNAVSKDGLKKCLFFKDLIDFVELDEPKNLLSPLNGQRELGTTFKEGGDTLMVCEAISGCNGCYYDYTPAYNWRMCRQDSMFFPQGGICEGRIDNKKIIFKKI